MKKNKLILATLGSVVLIGATIPVVACNKPSAKTMFIKLAGSGEDIPSELTIQQTIEIAAYDVDGNVIENVTFESLDSTVEITDGNKVKGVQTGSADIKASLGGYRDAHCYLNVIPLPTMSIKTINGEELPNPILIKQSIQIAAYNKGGTRIENATFSTTSKKIKITGNTVEGAEKGEAVIKCKAEGYQPAETTINVDGIEVKNIEINGNPYIDVQTTSALSLVVLPEDASDKSVTFTSNKEEVATVDKNGVITGVSPGKATITATANDGSGTKKEFNVYIKQPHVWGDEQAYIFDIDSMLERNITDLIESGVCSSSEGSIAPIICDDKWEYDGYDFNYPIYLNPSLTEIPDFFLHQKASFNQPLVIPDNVKKIGTNFMKYTIRFNQSLTLPNSLTSIGWAFMERCWDFNQKFDIPQSVTSIGGNFMYECKSFNQEIELPQNLISVPNDFLINCTNFNQKIVLPDSITTIGSHFLFNDTSFDQPLLLPNKLITINEGFLCGCTYFNQTLILPNSLKKVSDYRFMYGLEWMTQTLDIQSLDVNVFVTEGVGYDKFCLSTGNKKCQMISKGIVVDGTHANDFRRKYSNSAYEAEGFYRHLKSKYSF